MAVSLVMAFGALTLGLVRAFDPERARPPLKARPGSSTPGPTGRSGRRVRVPRRKGPVFAAPPDQLRATSSVAPDRTGRTGRTSGRVGPGTAACSWSRPGSTRRSATPCRRTSRPNSPRRSRPSGRGAPRWRCSSTERVSGRGRLHRALHRAAPLAVAAVVGCLTWPVDHQVEAAGFDTFWQAALHVAAHEGRDFGEGFSFTWGPLGFLSWPQAYYPGTAVAGTVALALAYFATLGLVARLLCSSLGLIAGAVVTFLVAKLAYPLVGLPELLEALFMLICLSLVLDRDSELTPLSAAGLGCCPLSPPGEGERRHGHLGAVADRSGLPVFESAGSRRARLGTPRRAWRPTRGARGPVARRSPEPPGGSAVPGGLGATGPRVSRRGGDRAARAGSGVRLCRRRGAGSPSWRSSRAAPVLAEAMGPGAVLAAYVGLLFRHGFTRHDEHSLFAFFAPVLVGAVALVRPGRRTVAAVAAIPWYSGACRSVTPRTCSA